MRKRLAALREDGVLHGFVAYPAADALGRAAVGAAWPRAADLDALLRVPDTAWVADSFDGMCGALAYTRDPAAWHAAADALVGAAPIQRSVLPARSLPPLGPLEWRVARAMLDAPTGSLRALADATGLSPRTVGARRAALLASRALIVEPVLRTSRAGAIVCHVNVRAPRAAWPKARELLGETIVAADYADSVYLFCWAPDMATHARRVEAVRRAPGVERVDVVLNREFRVATDRLRAWIDEALDAWRGASRGARPTPGA